MKKLSLKNVLLEQNENEFSGLSVAWKEAKVLLNNVAELLPDIMKELNNYMNTKGYDPGDPLSFAHKDVQKKFAEIAYDTLENEADW